MPKSSSRSADTIRKLLRPNAERLSFDIGGPDLFICGETGDLVNRMTVLGEASETREPLDFVTREKMKAGGIPIRWPKTSRKASPTQSGPD